MEIQIQLPLRGLNATYLIEYKENDIMIARLRQFSGNRPPSYIKFSRTAGGWFTPLDDTNLVQAIREAEKLSFVRTAL